MILYAESSAVLGWLLGEPSQGAVVAELAAAQRVVTAAITVIECARALSRARHARRITPVEERAALHLLDEALASWHLLELSDDIVRRARGPFPVEPVRSLDAVHLASAWSLLDAGAPVTMLAFDERVRVNARALGLGVTPA